MHGILYNLKPLQPSWKNAIKPENAIKTEIADGNANAVNSLKWH